VIPSVSQGPGVFLDTKRGQYIIATTGNTDKGDMRMWSSTNLVDWTMSGYVFPKGTLPKWIVGEGVFWAPEIHYANGKYIVVFSASCSGHMKSTDFSHKTPVCIGIAHAKNPLGPWTDVGKPLIHIDYHVNIDPTFIQDKKTKEAYIVWKTFDSRGGVGWVRILPLNKNLASVKEGAKSRDLLRKDLKWEGNVLEGPNCFYRKGWYYIFYAANSYTSKKCLYAIGVARSKNVLGPYVKKGPAIISKNSEWCNPGSPSVTRIKTDKTRTAIIYHASNKNQANPRVTLMDELKWDKKGWPFIKGNKPSTTSRPIPDGNK
jgi:beta-xylosidase